MIRPRHASGPAVALTSAIAAFLMVLATGAHAQGTSVQGVAAAEALFERGRKLMAEGKLAEACASFDESQKLAPATGTLLNLGNCFEKAGRSASAWAAFRQAAVSARQSNQADRETYARDRAAQLEPNLARLTIQVSPTAQQARAEITRDGVVIGGAEVGMSIPVDPGRHTIGASAAGKKAWSTTIEVKASGEATVDIPALEDAPTEAITATAPSPSPPTTVVAPDTNGPNRTLWIAGLGTAGVGVGLVAVASIFGASASSKSSDLEALAASRGAWSNDQQTTYDDGKAAATTATVLFAVGGVAIAAGVVLSILNWPRSRSPSAKAAPLSWTF